MSCIVVCSGRAGIDLVWQYGRRQSHYQHHHAAFYQPHPFVSLMRRTREINAVRKEPLDKLPQDFDFYPGNVALAKPVLRPQDRAILFEEDQENIAALTDYIGNDRRFTIHPTSFTDPEWHPNLVDAHCRPLTSHALVNIAIEGRSPQEVEDQVAIVGKQIIPSAMKRFPQATYMVSYPIFGRKFQDDLARDVIRSGVRHAINATFHLQDGTPKCTLPPPYALQDAEPW